MNKKFLYGLSTMIGMIVGVGIFGIPYAMAQAGFLIGLFYLIVLTGALLLIHLSYGEIVLRSEGDHGLVGFGGKYLGGRGKAILGAIIIFEFWGALLAYMIAGGKFINIAFGSFLPLGEFSGVILFFLAGSLIILFGLKTIARSEFFLAAFLILIAAVFIFKGMPLINFENLSSINWAKFFFPYGIIFFSLTGGAAIPEIRQILKGEERKLKKIIIWGTLLPACLYLLFSISILGVSGQNTTEDAISGLVPYFGRWVILIGAIFGFFAVISSHVIIGNHLLRVFHRDYRLNRYFSLFLVFFVPLLVFLFGINDFILVVGFIGAVVVGLEGIMILLIYRKAQKKGERRPEYSLKAGNLFFWLLAGLFILGIIYQLIYITT